MLLSADGPLGESARVLRPGKLAWTPGGLVLWTGTNVPVMNGWSHRHHTLATSGCRRTGGHWCAVKKGFSYSDIAGRLLPRRRPRPDPLFRSYLDRWLQAPVYLVRYHFFGEADYTKKVCFNAGPCPEP